MLVAFTVAAVLATPQGSFDQERSLLGRRLETLRRILPDGRHEARDVALVEALGASSGLPALQVSAQPVLAEEPRHVVLHAEGNATYSDIDRFFSQIALSHRLIDVAQLELRSGSGDLIAFETQLRIPYHQPGTALLAAPGVTRDLLRGVPVAIAEAFRRDEALALVKSQAIASLRRGRRNPRLFLAEIAAVVRDRPVILTHATLNDEFLIRGLTVGEGSVRMLETRFESGFFRVAEFLMAVSGSCHRFEVRGTSPVVGPEAELPIPADDPFRKEDVPCQIDRDPGVARVFRAGKPNGGQGPLSVRLRDVDLVDAFQVLHSLTGQGFVIDGDVRGRVSLELTNVTLEEAVRTLRGAGLAISPPGLIRRVTRSGGDGSPGPHLEAAADPEQSRVTFSLKRAEVREVLAVMTEIDPEFASVGPQASLGRVSIWVEDAPLSLIRAAVVESAGLRERSEEQRILERSSGASEALFPVVWNEPPRALVLRPQDLAVDEFELAGLASAGRGWTGFAYAVTGVLQVYRPGERLADAAVTAVESTDVVLESAGSPFRFFLAAP
jgi:hypothetical protein